MSAKFYTLLTEIGAAKLASAAALGVPLKITKMAVGDGGGMLPTPNAKQTALVNEKRRADLNMLYIDPQNSSQIIAEQVIPETEGGWWVREVGLFDDTGALIAVGNCPESYKPQLAEGSGRTQTVRMVLITSSTENITLKIDPAVVLATRKYVDDKVLELKVYVDDLMAKHLAATDPHTQYAPKESPTLTGTPKAPTAAQTANNTQIATTAFVKSAIAALVASSPAALDTLNELAEALGNDPNFATTMTNALAGKQPLNSTLTDLSGKSVAGILEYLGLGDASGYVGRLLKIQVFYNSGIYNPTPGTKKVIVEMVGGGGGGAGSRSASSGQISVGGAGGAGSYAKGQFTQNFSGVQITVGAKGAGGTSSWPYASDGGTSSFGSLITAAGGSAGQPAGPANSFPFSTVAAVVSAGANGANIIGTPGQGASASIAVSAAVVTESPGGSSQFGAGGFITAFNAKGVNGSGYGSGGGPSKVNGANAAVAGGDGSQGLVIVWEYA
ncbi:phage tail protein [Escherichia coli]|nr:phage tail protein [Escherichia coli]